MSYAGFRICWDVEKNEMWGKYHSWGKKCNCGENISREEKSVCVGKIPN